MRRNRERIGRGREEKEERRRMRKREGIGEGMKGGRRGGKREGNRRWNGKREGTTNVYSSLGHIQPLACLKHNPFHLNTVVIYFWLSPVISRCPDC